MKRLINKDVPFITYIIHNKNMENGRTVTVYKPTQEYYILFELIKYCRLPSTFPDIGITVISEGSEPSLSDVSVTQDVSIDIKTPSSIENTNPSILRKLETRTAELHYANTACMEMKHELDRRDEKLKITDGLLKEATETIGAVIACCTYNSNDAVSAGKVSVDVKPVKRENDYQNDNRTNTGG